jgi:hypothetical protein
MEVMQVSKTNTMACPNLVEMVLQSNRSAYLDMLESSAKLVQLASTSMIMGTVNVYSAKISPTMLLMKRLVRTLASVSTSAIAYLRNQRLT